MPVRNLALLSVDLTVTWPGKNLEVHEFKTDTGVCSAFLVNYDTKYAATVKYGDEQYELPPWSVSIFPNCKTAVFNTARFLNEDDCSKQGIFLALIYNKEPASSNERDSITAYALWEQINVTRDSTHYLWYMTDVDQNEGLIRNGQSPLLTIMSAGHAKHVFINGQLSGFVYRSLEFPKLTFCQNVKLRVGNNKISLLGITVGLPNVGVHFETWNVGAVGLVTLKGLNEGTRLVSTKMVLQGLLPSKVLLVYFV